MEQVTIETLKLDGGHVALDFTNTVNARGACTGPDVLCNHGNLIAWGLRLGVITADEAKALRALPRGRGQAALVRAKKLREAIYRIFAKRGTPVDLALLQRELRAAQTVRKLVPSPHGYVWRWQAGDANPLTHRIAMAAADLLTSPSLPRVRVCPGENCGWLFLDISRPGRRIWCSEETCGTRNRVRRWRKRRRARSA
jgi:predicted RNA-binding Zn ribbon-like protein